MLLYFLGFLCLYRSFPQLAMNHFERYSIQNIQQWWWSIFLLDFIKVCFLYFRTWLLGVKNKANLHNVVEQFPKIALTLDTSLSSGPLKATNSGFSWSFSGSITHQINSQSLGKCCPSITEKTILMVTVSRYKLEPAKDMHIMKSGSVPYVKLPSSSEVY